MLRIFGAAVAAAQFSASATGCAEDPVAGDFFTDEERRALGALSNAVVPPDATTPGAADLGAATFIERLLTAFDASPPAIFADGPFSNRNPIPNGAGGASADFPPNDFARFRAIDRVTERAWRIALFGSNAAGPINDPTIVPPTPGLRDVIRDGVRAAMRGARAPLETLPLAEIADIFSGLEKELQETLIDLVSQASFGPPEYGGNAGLGGWAICHFEGDNQPLGYSVYDARTNTVVDRPDRPMTTKNPGVDPAPMDKTTLDLLQTVVAFTNGKVFP